VAWLAGLQAWFATPWQMGLLIAFSTLGWWACTVTARHMGVADPGHCWDEVVAFWLVLWLAMPMGSGAVRSLCAVPLF
jgi:phosphatidylglycerophosphatase A